MSNDQIPNPGAPTKPTRGKLNLTIHPEIKEFAVVLANARRDTISQLFEDLVEAEWNRVHGITPVYPPPRPHLLSPTANAYAPQPGYAPMAAGR